MPLYEVRQVTPLESETLEAWQRVVEGHDNDIHGVGASLGRHAAWPWRVFVNVMEFIRRVPLEGELQRLITLALLSVEGVTKAQHEDREVWLVAGTPKGDELIASVTEVVDGLARQTRAHIDQLR
ncbi:MAG TPA: hypothetical protein VLB44_00085 [Kofleriaceae bacterium]|nr:hypothetical protein [Kofleriaceae bacterium]